MEIASVRKRFSAYLLDIILLYLLTSLIISIRFINPNYDKYIETYEQYNEVLKKYYEKEITSDELVDLNKDNLYYLTKYSISSNIVVIIVIIGYFVFFQKYNHGQTLGKKIMKIKVVGNDNKELSIWKLFIRTIPTYYIFVGNALAVLLNTLVVLFIDKDNFIYVNSVITYLFLGIGIVSLVMIYINKNKQGLHDKLAQSIVVME